MEPNTAPGSSGDSRSDLEIEDEERAPESARPGWTDDRASGLVHPDGRAFLDAEDNLKFYPPLYRQRYETVQKILKDERWSPPPATIVEFGCAELAMFTYFKQVTHVTKVFMVDIDSDLIEYYGCRAAPLTCDYLSPRENALHVEVLCGSVADCDVRLLGANAVVCIELIEHLEQDIVDQLEKTIFGFIEPDIAVFTTPNSDFNVLLNGMQGKFRHYDHKFEWSRAEFVEWTNKVISQYPNYRVEISGVGILPEGNEEVGHCSQLALFIRNSDYTPISAKDVGEVYTVCKIFDHPVKPADTRSDDEKLQDEVQYQLNRLGFYECYLGQEDYSQIPLEDLTMAVKAVIPTANKESVKCHLPPEDLVEKNGDLCINFKVDSCRFSSTDSYIEEPGNLLDEENSATNDENQIVEVSNAHEEEEEEEWDVGPPGKFAGPDILVKYHLVLANHDNASNLMHESHLRMREIMGWSDPEDSASNEDDNNDEDYHEYYTEQSDERPLDCEKKWNTSAPPKAHSTCIKEPSEVVMVPSISPQIRDELAHGANCATFSPSNEQDIPILNSITDSGVDLSPLLNPSDSRDEMKDVFPSTNKCKVSTPYKTKDLPKSTSVEVLHSDGSCTLKHRAGLEFIEFAPSTSVALCYTGKTYCDLDKVPTSATMTMSSEHKSLDGSLVRDVVESCSLDLAGDSGYPNSSSLNHDVDVDLTPEQVDDISSENDDRSNHSFSEDELSESLDRAPALVCRVIHPGYPVIPIVFENVENGDLANNNRDGEGNNAIAPLGDEREFVALVQEGDMQPLLAAPVADDVILPNNADPFPHWLMDLLHIQDADEVPAMKMDFELEQDEGLGDDSI